ncbi:MAG: FHA domain-containing protein [Gammaproteobacteria bacterium]
MSYLNVYFNDELKSKFELKSIITKIGRNADNDVVIDNVGVSGNHAEIIRDGDKYVIYDMDSKNGVYVNGERVKDREIKFGDEIRIFKHKLRFIAIDLPGTVVTPDPVSPLEQSVHGATVEIDLSKLDGMLKDKIAKNAYIEISNGPSSGRKFKISKSRFSIGKSPDCDIQIGGWFAPKIAAKIVRQSDGFYLVPERRGKVRHKGNPLKNRIKLNHGSEIEIRGAQFQFFNET